MDRIKKIRSKSMVQKVVLGIFTLASLLGLAFVVYRFMIPQKINFSMRGLDDRRYVYANLVYTSDIKNFENSSQKYVYAITDDGLVFFIDGDIDFITKIYNNVTDVLDGKMESYKVKGFFNFYKNSTDRGDIFKAFEEYNITDSAVLYGGIIEYKLSDVLFYLVIAIGAILLFGGSYIVTNRNMNKMIVRLKEEGLADVDATHTFHKDVEIIDNSLVVTSASPSITDLNDVENTRLTVHRRNGIKTHYTLLLIPKPGYKAKTIMLPRMKNDQVDNLMEYLYQIGKNYQN